MTCKGVVKGKTIELEHALPFLEGQSVTISVEPAEDDLLRGSPAALLKAMHELPHLEKGDIEEFERVLMENKLPANGRGIFDEDEPI